MQMIKASNQGLASVEASVSSPSSPRSEDHNGWMLVERPATEGAPEALDIRPRAISPSPEASVDNSCEQEEQLDGMKSPESERLADDVLREPFQASGPLRLQLPAPPPAPTAEDPAVPTTASGPFTSSCGDLHFPVALHHAASAPGASSTVAAHSSRDDDGCYDAAAAAAHWCFERQRERLHAASRLSGEGALEGFHDPPDLPFADTGGAGGAMRLTTATEDAELARAVSGTLSDTDTSPVVVSLGWEGLLAGMWADMSRELEDVRALLSTGALALWDRVQDGRMAVEEWAGAMRTAAHQARKSASGRSNVPMWALLSMSGVAVLALAALSYQLGANRKMALQLRQRERELARLVVKILNLQDALQSAARSVPLLRAASHLDRYTTTTSLIGMV